MADDSFDPYYTWLGIPPEEQPPHYYRLLGLSLFESNVDAISNAADRQMLQLRTFQTGKRAALSQKLLNEVAAARLCLLTPEKKAAYDARLRKLLAARAKQARPGRGAPQSDRPQPPSPTTGAAAASEATAAPTGDKSFPDLRVDLHAKQRIGRPSRRRPARRAVWFLVLLGAVAAGTLGILYTVQWGPFAGGPAKKTAAKSESNAGAATTPGLTAAKQPDRNQVKPLTLAAIPDQTLKPTEQLRVSPKIADIGGLDAAKLHFSLLPGAPAGMRIDPKQGTITWQPSADVDSGDYRVTVRVQADPPSGAAAEQTFVVHVPKMEPPRPPVLAAIADQTVKAGDTFTLAVRMDDPGSDAKQLVFRLAAGAPSGMKIDARRGTITWRPARDNVGDHAVTVCVESTRFPDLRAEKTFRIHVAAPDMRPASKIETAVKSPVPDEASQERVLAALKETYQREYAGRQAHVQLALAARMIQQARASSVEPAKRFVLLQEARKLAAQQGDFLLPRLAVDELAAHFKIDPQALRVADFVAAARRVRTRSGIELTVETAAMLGRRASTIETYDALLPALRRVEKLAAKNAKTGLGGTVQETRIQVQAMRELCQQATTATNAQDNDTDGGAAKLAQGRFYCLAHGDWKKGLPLLADGADQRLRGVAARLAATPDDVAAQLAMADAWWELAQKQRRDAGLRLLLLAAARHWYQRALPRLAGNDLTRVQSRLVMPAPSGKRPFLIALHGVGGLAGMAPKKVTGKIAPTGPFATIQGQCDLRYDPVPASSYIQELALTFPLPQGMVSFTYGGPEVGARLVFSWNNEQKKIICRLYTYRNGIVYWSGDRKYDPREPLRFTLYVNENRQWLYQNGSRILGTGARPSDLTFSVHSDSKAMAVIARCEFRPWIQADADFCRCSMPPTRIETDSAEAALRLHARVFALSDRPVLSDGKSFVVGSTGTVMQWIPSGKFKRPPAATKNQPAANAGTEITITRGFWIGRYEISQAEWSTVMPAPAGTIRATGSPLLPVDGARYEDATAFCQLLTTKEKRAHRIPPGYQYRLPTEAEWEYACRAGGSAPFSVAADGFWSVETSHGHPHQIGQGRPNAWGLFDMHGNVDEWCYDAWRKAPKTPVFRLTDPVVLPQSSTKSFVLRGGAWWKPRRDCACGAREQSRSIAGGWRGFRIVLAPAIR